MPFASILTARTAIPVDRAPRPASKRVAVTSRALDLLWRSGLQDRPVLHPDALIAAARMRTGLHRVEDGPWRTNLTILCRALNETAALNPLGETIAHGQLAGAIGDRLRVEDLWRRHPEIAEVPVAPPVVVLGQMRSGSTRIQRLLACDDRLAHTRFFESWNPVPVTRKVFGWDDRKVRGRAGLMIARALNPDFGHIHPTWTNAPDEETGLFSLSLFGTAFETQWCVPAFARACERADTVPIYRELRRLLQTLAWLRGGDTRPWILKSPQLAQDLPSLREVFPGARFVVLHRASETVVASSASLALNQMQLQSDHADAHWVGREWLRKVAYRQQRIADAETPALARVDVAFDEVEHDWRAAITRIYALIGLDLDEALLSRMEKMLARTRRHRLDKHRYALSDFGLSAEQVRRRFTDS